MEEEYIPIHRMANVFETIKQRLKNSSIRERNKNLILGFCEECKAKELSNARILKYSTTLLTLAKLLNKDFSKVGRKDVQKLLIKIEEQPYSEWTKKDFRVALKKFYKWLDNGKYFEAVAWLKTTLPPSKLKIPTNILTEEEIKRIVEAARLTRDKAFIFTLYESAARIEEIGSLRIKHIHFDDHGTVLVVKGKTGMRRLRVVASDPYLRAWLNEHPLKEDPNAPLWVKQSGNKVLPLSYASLSKILKRAASRAGIKKRVHAHLLRHSRLTFLAQHLTESQLSLYAGWIQGSQMPRPYVHLSGKQLDDAILGIYGIKRVEEKRPKIEVKICPRCQTKNTFASKFCSRCGLVLDVKTAEEIKSVKGMVHEILERLLEKPEVMDKLKEVVKEWKKEKKLL